MNNTRRNAIKTIVSRFDDLSALIEELKTDIETIIEEEQDAFDNLPEGFQTGARGEKMEAAIENLQSAADFLEEIDLEELTGYLEEAMQ